MKKCNILVTGVGAIIGYGIIRSLRNSSYDCNIIGMDIYPDAVGQAWCDTFLQAIPAKDENYIDFVLKVLKKYSIDLMFLGTEQEINRLSEARDQLGEFYRKVVLNRSDIIDMTNDKWKTYQFLLENDLPTIPTMINGNYYEIVEKLGSPFLFKPRQSYAGKGMAIIKNESDLKYYQSLVPFSNFMVQRIIGDNEHEYTSAIFGYGDGECLSPITLQRKLSQEGATAKARKIDCKEIDSLIMKMVQILKPVGPTNFQFRKHQDKYYLLEINPRISSSTSIRMSLGYNEAEMSIDWFLFGKKPKKPLIKEGMVVRYIEDMVQIL